MHRRAQSQVRALLEAQLEQLPAIDGGRRWAISRPPPRRGLAAGAGSGVAPSPSVNEKNRSSSVTVCGASALISAPASTSACESSVTAASSAVNTELAVLVTVGVADPGLGLADRSARSSSVVSSR